LFERKCVYDQGGWVWEQGGKEEEKGTVTYGNFFVFKAGNLGRKEVKRNKGKLKPSKGTSFQGVLFKRLVSRGSLHKTCFKGFSS